MAFEPDILVIDPHKSNLMLAVEVKVSVGDLSVAEQQLRRYMAFASCPTAMLVSLDTLRIYRDTFHAHGEGSIELVGEFPSKAFLSSAELAFIAAASGAQERAYRLEDAVQTWLEGLVHEAALAHLPADLRGAIEEHILPALSSGEVQAGAPRWYRAAS